MLSWKSSCLCVSHLSVCLSVMLVAGLLAQAPPATPTAPATSAGATEPKPPPSVVAGIPVNYDEGKVGTYTLPDVLKPNDGKPVKDAKTWNDKRRPDLLKMFETQQYGVAPGRPAGESFE
jgi:hypothetical protein